MADLAPNPPRGITRRRLLQGGLISAAGLAVYSGEIERHWIEISRIPIAIPGLPEAFHGIKVVQVSDIHMDAFTEPFFLRHAVEEINSLQPDLILLTGDFISSGPGSRDFIFHAAWQCGEILKGLTCRELYGSLGNHDVFMGSKQIIEVLAAQGITVLHNSYLPIERNGGRIWLAGLDDPLSGVPDPDKAIPSSIRNLPHEPVILMCHGPDYADYLAVDPAGSSIKLMLSGHTHGGQVRLPLIGSMALPPMGKKYISGHFRFGDMQLYVNRGLGTVGIPFRFNCPPEITLFTLSRA